MARSRGNQMELDLTGADERAMLDRLIDEARLYRTSTDYKELLRFVARLRNFAPFNAMLLHLQKPGLTYAATAADWRVRFKRSPKPDARPLLILWPFGPVALVYDIQDTDGEPLPKDVESFYARGASTDKAIAEAIERIAGKGVAVTYFDAGDAKAGHIVVRRKSSDPKLYSAYEIGLNRNHPPATRFVTIAHELAHLFLGHLGPDEKLRVPERPVGDLPQREIEAESIAYLVAARNGLESNSRSYLSRFVDPLPPLDRYTGMRAAGQVEQMLGVSESAR